MPLKEGNKTEEGKSGATLRGSEMNGAVSKIEIIETHMNRKDNLNHLH